MTTINLYQNQAAIQKKKSPVALNKGLIFSLGIIALALLILGGIKMTVSVFTARNQAAVRDIQKEKENLAGLGSLELIIDIQTRLSQIKDNLKIKNNKISRIEMTQILDHLGMDLQAGVGVSSYEYKDGKINATFVANNFNDAARQILNFKKSDYFTEVNLIKIGRSEKGVEGSVEMSTK